MDITRKAETEIIYQERNVSYDPPITIALLKDSNGFFIKMRSMYGLNIERLDAELVLHLTNIIKENTNSQTRLRNINLTCK